MCGVAVRSPLERNANTLAKLAEDLDVWVATASGTGQPHLVPLSPAWDGECVIVTTEAASVTARNVMRAGVWVV